MNKRNLRKKLELNKETVADLSLNEMKNSRAGEAPTMVGMSCITDILCCITTDKRHLVNHMGNASQALTEADTCI